jgi:glycine hydroxymethyltransferase
MYDLIHAQDDQLAQAMRDEYTRQTGKLELIASENFVSPAVLEAAGSVLTHKYAEGYPGRRYYGGCEHVDVVEKLAIERVRKLFGADHANVQPHSGSTANMIAYHALIKPGETMMGLALAHGGHMTHGLRVNFSGFNYRVISYGLDAKTELVDYDALEKSAMEHKPRLIIAGYSAYPRVLDFERFREIADRVGALLLTDMAHFAGLAAVGEYPNPVALSDVVTSTTHKTLRGPRSGVILSRHEHQDAVDRAVFPGFQGGPLMHIIAAKAVAFAEALKPGFRDYQKQTRLNARVLSDALQSEGLRIVSGGTDNHLLLVDLSKFGITGKNAEKCLDDAGITCNKNMIPFDSRKPTVTSGIRLGTPALTTRGMKDDHMKKIASWIATILRDPDNLALRNEIAATIREFTSDFPQHVSVNDQEPVMA